MKKDRTKESCAIDRSLQRRIDASIAINHPIGDLNPIQLREAICLAILEQKEVP